jgi:hypothetical protein
MEWTGGGKRRLIKRDPPLALEHLEPRTMLSAAPLSLPSVLLVPDLSAESALVAAVSTNTSLNGPLTVVAGQAATYTANVSASGATVNGGTVTLFDGTTELGNAVVNGVGGVTFQTSTLALGNHALTASYGGTSTFDGSTSSALSVRVVGATTSLSTNWSTPIAGQAWTVNAAVNGTLLTNTPRTGTLTLTQGTTVLASVDIATATPNGSGYYALQVPGGLALGANTLKLTYSGDANYGASTVTYMLTVYNDALSVSYSAPLAGQPYTVKAKVLGPLIGAAARTGTLSLVEGTTVLATVDITQATADANGYYSLLVSSGFSAGLHSFKVLYSGDAVYNALTSPTMTASFV